MQHSSNDRRFFEELLVEKFADTSACLLYSRWLAERGDPAAAGYAWQAEQHKRPSRAANTWDWWSDASNNPDEIRLPQTIWELLSNEAHPYWHNCKEYLTRKEADAALHAVLETAQFPVLPSKQPR